MATYVYECANQGCWQLDKPVEMQHPIADCDKPHVCGECGGPMHRVPQVAQVYWPGRYYGQRDGWWDGGFPTMESVRDGEHAHSGVTLPNG